MLILSKLVHVGVYDVIRSRYDYGREPLSLRSPLYNVTGEVTYMYMYVCVCMYVCLCTYVVHISLVTCLCEETTVIRHRYNYGREPLQLGLC